MQPIGKRKQAMVRSFTEWRALDGAWAMQERIHDFEISEGLTVLKILAQQHAATG